MRLCPYLCSMKTIKLISFTAFVFCLNMPLHAQFNTIGSIDKKHIKTGKPSKLKEALTDSIVVADSVPDFTTLDIGGNKQTIVPSLDNQELMLLVALPLKSIHVNSGFGMRRHPIYHKRIMHNGIDLSARYEKVYSMFPGTVIKVGQDSRSGKFVTVRTGDYTISYCHLSQQLVKEKEFVNAGTNIAISGNTGASTGPHLHITAKKDGQAFNAAILLEYIKKMRMLADDSYSSQIIKSLSRGMEY